MTGGVDSVIFKDGPVRSLLDTELLNIIQLAAGHVAVPPTGHVAVPPTSLLAGWFLGDTRRCFDCYWCECRTAGKA